MRLPRQAVAADALKAHLKLCFHAVKCNEGKLLMPSKLFSKLEPRTRVKNSPGGGYSRGKLGSRTLRRAKWLCAAETLLTWMGREILSSCSELGEGPEGRNGEREEPGL